MNKQDLARAVAQKAGITNRTAAKAIDAVVETIKTTLGQNEKVSLVGFGTFEVHMRAPRSGRNPQTGELVPIPGGNVPGFRSGKDFREAMPAAKPLSVRMRNKAKAPK